MDKRIAQLWHDALISGRYKQNTGALRTTGRGKGSYHYCCLGVLTNICINDREIKFNKRWHIEYDGGIQHQSDEESCYVPIKLADELGIDKDPTLKIPLTSWSTKVPDQEAPPTSTDLNDSHKLSFKQIAECVKETYLKDEQ